MSSKLIQTAFAALLVLGSTLEAAGLGVVDFKICVENSKMGKKERENFDVLKKKMEGQLEEKEKSLKDMATKLEDTDYLDSLSPEGETDLKRKFRALNQEMATLQNQFLQLLQQTNVKILQKMHESVEKASASVAKEKGLDAVLNKEACFFVTPALDISNTVVERLDKQFEEEKKSTDEGLHP